jgi:hypothetical protein
MRFFGQQYCRIPVRFRGNIREYGMILHVVLSEEAAMGYLCEMCHGKWVRLCAAWLTWLRHSPPRGSRCRGSRGMPQCFPAPRAEPGTGHAGPGYQVPLFFSYDVNFKNCLLMLPKF